MAAFRRVVTAFAVVVLLAGLASAATVSVGPAFSCDASAAVPPLLRSEGLTELTGDIVLNCTGAGLTGTANFSVFVGNTVVTSRIVNTTTQESEALLMIDEPGSPLSSNVPELNVNVFKGVVSGNSVTFVGVPVEPPGTSDSLPAPTRIYRITNIRVNATTIGGGPGGTPGQVQAYVSISGNTSVPINNPTQTVGFVQPGLSFDGLYDANDHASAGFTFRQCDEIGEESSGLPGYLRFTELFATAFKPQGGSGQTVPGAIYNTESGISPAATGLSTISVADWGTRLRATFDNIPLGTSVWVARTNYANSTVDHTEAAILTTGTEIQAFDDGGDDWVKVVASNQTSGVAVWEVQGGVCVNANEDDVPCSNPTIRESLDFGIYFVTSPNGQASPAAGVQGTVAGSFAPAPPAFTLSTYSKATTKYVPRFVDTGVAKNLIIFNVCQTNLLFPYVLGGVAGFDTGLAITNTSEDPWGTSPQSGACELNFYGAEAPDAFTTPSIGAADTDSGVLWASTAMSLAPGFQGYIIAICDFQYAHGFAFVSDIGAHNIAMGYLALILPDIEALGTRPVAVPEALDN